jgi:hypothetical protein
MFHKEFRQCTKECLVQKMFGVLRGKQNRLENSHVYCLTVPLNTNAKNGLSSQGSLDDSPVRAASPRPSSLSPHGTRMPKIKFQSQGTCRRLTRSLITKVLRFRLTPLFLQTFSFPRLNKHNINNNNGHSSSPGAA